MGEESQTIGPAVVIDDARPASHAPLLTVKTSDGNVIQNPFLPMVKGQALLVLRAGAEMASAL